MLIKGLSCIQHIGWRMANLEKMRGDRASEGSEHAASLLGSCVSKPFGKMRADRACPELLKQLSKRGKPDFGIGCPCGNESLNTPTQGMGCFRANAYDKVARPDNTGNAYNANMDNGNINNNDKTNTNYVRCVRSENQDIFGFESLYKAYINCRKNKRSTINSLLFEQNLEENLLALEQELKNRDYKPKRSICFTILKPKPREIFAADFRDRIVHHLLVSYLSEIFEPKFIYDSYACRKNKGTHKAVVKVKKFLRKATLNNKKRAYYLQLDIYNFFMSISKEILYSLMKKHVKGNNMLWLLRIVIFNEPAENYIQKSPAAIRKKVPSHKSLLNAPKGNGLPIGNYTSQFFANVYLNELDQFVKHKLKCRYYLRYVDDFILISESKEQLRKYKAEIEKFLKQNLNLSLNLKQKMLPASNGVNFLGYVIRQNYTLARRRVVHNFREKLDSYRKDMISETQEFRQITYNNTCSLQATVNSYLGHFKWADAYNLKKAMLLEHKWLYYYFEFSKSIAKLRFKNKSALLKKQYAYFRKKLPSFAVIIQLASSYYIFSGQAKFLSKFLHLKLFQNKNSWYEFKAEFPEQKLEQYIAELAKNGIFTAVIKEDEDSNFHRLDAIYTK